ncbi:aquaporin-11-like [Mytilus edulis]
MAWRALWQLTMGESPELEDFLSPVTGSLVYFIVTMGTGVIFRVLNKQYSPAWCQQYIADFSATLEMCAYFFENNFIMKHYGAIWLFIAVVVQCLVANRTYFGASENPVKSFYDLCTNKISTKTAITKILVQTLAGATSYYFARMVWALDLVEDHRERYLETVCDTDLSVALTVGLTIELGATLIDTWLGLQTLVPQSFIDEVLKCSNGAFMIVMGMHLTGMYFNPAMAFGHMFGCRGTSAWEHFIVYWIGPFIGCYMALVFDNKLHIDVTKSKMDTEKKEK